MCRAHLIREGRKRKRLSGYDNDSRGTLRTLRHIAHLNLGKLGKRYSRDRTFISPCVESECYARSSTFSETLPPPASMHDLLGIEHQQRTL